MDVPEGQGTMIEIVGAAGDFDEIDAEVIEKLRSRLIDNVDDFWARNRGDVSINWVRDGKAAQLVLYYSRLHGYHVMHKGFGENDHVALGRVGGSDAPVTIYFGGEPVVVPARAFVPAQTLWVVLEQLLRDPQRPQAPQEHEWSVEFATDDAAHLLTLEQGHHTAVDSPWGYLRTTLSTDGAVTFYRRQGTFRQTRFGRVAGERVDSLLAALRRTNFPTQTQTEFPPGSSVFVLTLEPPNDKVPLEYFTAIKIDGYREVLQQFMEIAMAFVEDHLDKLASWDFKEVVA